MLRKRVIIPLLQHFMKVKQVSLRVWGLSISRLLSIVNYLRWKKPAQPEKIIWIKPNRIKQSIEYSDLVQGRRYYWNGVIRGGEWDENTSKLPFYLFKVFEKRFIEQVPFRETAYFQNGKSAKIEKYEKMYKEIKMSGFKTPTSIFDEVDSFKVSISSTGELLFMTGKHRLAIARLMGDDFQIPVEVSHRHAEWQKYRDRLYEACEKGNMTKGDILQIDHPDLMDIVE